MDYGVNGFNTTSRSKITEKRGEWFVGRQLLVFLKVKTLSANVVMDTEKMRITSGTLLLANLKCMSL